FCRSFDFVLFFLFVAGGCDGLRCLVVVVGGFDESWLRLFSVTGPALRPEPACTGSAAVPA
ncbi:hypothetical protein, partial [Klebsiella michiganensis]|uniref:hypothetical protein n=1 Tax=Klebsiella michiganensis TaxID=1134687 RepID=UPI001CE2ED72